MAWIKGEIVVSGETVTGHINMSNDTVLIEVPYAEGVETGSAVSVQGKDFVLNSVVNVGNRNETLLLGAKNDEQVSRRAKGKAK